MALQKDLVTYNGVDYNYIRIVSFEKSEDSNVLIHLKAYKNKDYRDKEIRIKNYIKNYNEIMNNYYEIKYFHSRENLEPSEENKQIMKDVENLIKEHEEYMSKGGELFNAVIDITLHESDIEDLSFKSIYTALSSLDEFNGAENV